MFDDVRFALRLMVKSPGFTLAAVASLALGIGANTAVFSVVEAVLVRTLPVLRPLELSEISVSSPAGEANSFSYPLWRNLNSIAPIAAFAGTSLTMGGEVIAGEYVSGNYFKLLGVRPASGRLVAPGETGPVAVLSHSFWKRRFGGETIGSIDLNGKSFAVAGVAAEGFFGLRTGSSPDVWVPVETEPLLTTSGRAVLGSSTFSWLRLVGRSLQVEQLQPLFASETVRLSPAAKGVGGLRERLARPLWILMAMVGMVLAIACANVANLLIARAAARRKEMSVRVALGATRWRIARQLLTESVVLAALGAMAGAVAASWGVDALTAFLPDGVEVSPNGTVLAFTALITLATGLLFGLAPALKRLPLGRVLVAAQIAVALVLVAGAAMLGTSLEKLRLTDAGFERQNLVLATVAPGAKGYRGEKLAAFYSRLTEEAMAVPGVRAVALGRVRLLTGGMMVETVEGRDAHMNVVGPGYFDTLGVRMAAGREFSRRDSMGAARVAIVNETMARTFFNGDAVGRRVNEAEIVGVSRDVRYASLREAAPPTFYLPVDQQLERSGQVTLHVRAAGDAPAVVAALRRKIEAPLSDVRTQGEEVDELLADERLLAGLGAFFGLAALVLAAVGLYGLFAYSVERRRKELGIRLALGAPRGLVTRMVLRDAARLAAVGLAAGVPLYLFTARFLKAFLYGVEASDPWLIAAACVVMGGTALAAAWAPARRAGAVDPMQSLRYE